MSFCAIPTGDAAVVFLAEALGRERGLSEIEERVLRRAMLRPVESYRRWSEQDDRALLKMHKAKIKGADIAATMNRTEDAVRWRLSYLKKAARVK